MANKQSLMADIKAQIEANHSAGRDLRHNIKANYTIDGKKFRVDNVSRYVRSGFKTNPTWGDTSIKKGGKATRKQKTLKANEGVKQWAKRLTKQKKWPEGKSLEGFEKWLSSSYGDAQDIAKAETNITGVKHHAGHGVSAVDSGPSSPSNLANQAATRNLMQSGTTPKSKEDLRQALISTDMEEAFGEYLMEQDENILQPQRHTQDQKTAIVHGEGNTEAAMLKADAELVDRAGQRNLYNPPKTMKIGGGLRTADSLAQIASGNVIGGGVGLALQQEPIQKQIAKLLAKRAAKTSAKLVPGVDIGLSAAEAAQYFASGNYIQGGIASLSGAVGWIPGVGDAASAALDLANTGMDINKLKAQGITNRHKKIDADRFDLSLKGFKAI
jgi:hypothetical protein